MQKLKAVPNIFYGAENAAMLIVASASAVILINLVAFVAAVNTELEAIQAPSTIKTAIRAKWS